MKEVSCRPFELFFKRAAKEGVDAEKLVSGTGYALAHWRNKNERVEWDSLVRFLSNAHTLWTDEQLIAAGADTFKAVSQFGLIARCLFDARGFYEWVFQKQVGAGDQTFACIEPSIETMADGRLKLGMKLKPGYQFSREFFLVCMGNYKFMPSVLGLPASEVEMQLEPPSGASYLVKLPEGGAYARNFWRAIKKPFDSRSMAMELRDANLVLTTRYDELNRAREKLQQHADELEKVNAELQRYQTELEERVEARTADLRRTTQQLEVALEKQRELDRAKTEFFANAQHELRTPLTLLLAPVETLSRDSRLPEDVREELSASLRSGYRLLKLVNDVLDLSKVEAGRLRLQVAAVDLSRLMREAVRPFTAQLRGRNVELRFELPEKLELVADPERLEQVLLNILSNAVRFTPDGGTIQLGASASNSSVELYIENSGEQIPEPELEKLFQRFAQSSSASMRRYGTTGLGLSVVKELIELHGGTVSAKNVENGVRFILSVPMTASPEHFPVSEAMKPSSRELRQYEVSGESDAARAAPPHSTELTHEKPLLLIAEDNSELRSYIVRHLRHDYEILEASDGAMAFKLATEKLPDLILSDLMMPELSGAELCAKVKAHPQLQSTPFILLTARSDMNTRLSGLEEGADDFLVKPFSLDEVKARLRTHLRVRMLNQRAAHREKLAALGTMIAGVAHEMRNPLNGIVNSLRPLRELLKAPEPEVSELLDIAIDSCERVEKISTQLLRQAHPGEWTRSEVDVAENVRTAAALMAFKTSSGPNLVVDLDAAKSARVIGEAGALNQVWVNLLDNAIQAAGPTGQVTVTVEQSAKQISVDVSDNGPGIPPGVLSRIFDPFFTTKRVGTGTGLGLSFVRQIVETHGGSVSVQSSPGEGARFRVTLPAMNAAMGEVRAS